LDALDLEKQRAKSAQLPPGLSAHQTVTRQKKLIALENKSK